LTIDIELDILKNGVLLGDSVMFKNGRVTLLGVGEMDGNPYYSREEILLSIKPPELNGLFVYMKDTGTKDPLPWDKEASVLKYPVTSLKKPVKPNRFIKK